MKYRYGYRWVRKNSKWFRRPVGYKSGVVSKSKTTINSAPKILDLITNVWECKAPHKRAHAFVAKVKMFGYDYVLVFYGDSVKLVILEKSKLYIYKPDKFKSLNYDFISSTPVYKTQADLATWVDNFNALFNGRYILTCKKLFDISA